MTTVGEMLRSAREKKKLTIDQIEKATKIRAKFLMAMESNEFAKLPGPTFARGFVKNYAAYLGLPIEDTLAFFRRQLSPDQTKITVQNPTRTPFAGWKFTPQLFTNLVIGLLLLVFFGYLLVSYFQYTGSPTLAVSTPANNVVVSEESIHVTGNTDPGASLTINGQQVSIAENGTFDVAVPLQPGLNTVTVSATNKFGRSHTVVRSLRLEKQ